MGTADDSASMEVPGGFGGQPLTRPYRLEIDGLRAVAIVPVVLFHSGLGLFAGGFVGVDVFFVISGYLITQILYREAGERRFSIAHFYARRVRRIFPALFFMLAATLAAGIWLLLPQELSALARSSIAATLFVSNILFYRESGYFATAAIYKPLLHTWSLGIEEQFYVFFPLGLWLVHRWKPKALLPVLFAVFVLSFGLNVALVGRFQSAVFYMLPTRAWELMAGGIVAIVSRRSNGILAAAGLMLIGLAAVGFHEGIPYPGLAALLPVAGTALVIGFGEGTGTGKLLSLAPIRGIGLISYSLYLWHWPVLTFARFALGTQLSPFATTGCIAFSVLMAWLSWAYVEAPFRKPGAPGPAIGVGLASMTGAIAISALLLPGYPSRLPASALTIHTPKIAEPPCFGDEADPDVARCVGGPVVLIGDSHALQFLKAATRQVPGLHFVGHAGCIPIEGVEFTRLGRVDHRCSRFNEQALSAIAQDRGVRTVILAGRWARLTFPQNDPEAQTASSDPGLALQQTVAMLHRHGKRVVLIGPVPEFKELLPSCLERAMWRGLAIGVCQHNELTVENPVVEDWLSSAGADQVIRPSEALCRSRDCPVMLDGQPVSRDRDHLSPAAAALVLQRLNFEQAVRAKS